MEAVRDAAILLNQEGTILYCNGRLEAMAHCPRGYPVGKPLVEFVLAEQASILKRLLADIPPGGRSDEFALRPSEPSGKPVPIQLSAHVISFDGLKGTAVIATDLTTQKACEDILRESNQELEKRLRTQEALAKAHEETETNRRRLEGILEAIPAAVVLIEASMGGFSYMNRRAAEIYGTNYVGFDLRAHLTRVKALRPDGRPYSFEELPVSRALKGEAVRDVEMTIERADGARLPVVVSAAPLRDARRNVTAAVAIFDDITERKEAERAQQVYRELLETVVNYLPAATSLIRGQDLRIQLVNPAYQAIAPGKQLLGKTLDEAWPETGRDFKELCRRVLTTGEPYQAVDQPNTIRRTEDGPLETAYFTWSLCRVRLPEEEGWGILNSAWETTERVRAEAKVRESEQRLRFALESSHTGAWDLDLVDHSAFRSLEHDRIFGYAELLPEWTYEMFLQHVLPEDRAAVDLKFRQAVAAQTDWSFECRIRRADGEVRWIWAAGRHGGDGGEGPRRMAGIVQDITERKLAEETLRQSREDLDRAQAVGQIGSWRLDVRRNVLTWSDENYNIFGIPKGTPLSYETFLGIVHPEDRLYTDDRWQAALRGEPYDIEHRIVADGEVKWLREKAYLEFDQTGTLLGGFGITQDITKRKLAEEALRESERLYRAIGESINYGIWICDARGRNVYASESFLKLVGITQEQCAEFGWGSVLHPEDTEATINAWKQCVQTGEPWYREHRFKGADGRWHPILACGVPVRDDRGQVTCWAGINLDISRLKQTEASLRESEQRLTLALEAGQMGMWEWNLRTGHAVWNAKEYELLGSQAGDGVPSADLFFRLVHPEDVARLDRSLKEALNSGRDWMDEFRVVRPDGQTRWLAAAGRSLAGPSGLRERMVGVNFDITERKQAEEVLKRSNADLERLVAERTTKLQELVGELEHFSYTITHDMRAPLRAMQGFADLMAETCAGCQEQEAQRFLQRIRTSAKRMDLLIVDALNYNRTVRQELPLEPVDAGALLRGMLDSYPELQPSKAQILVEGEIPPVIANEAGLTQCFSNLLGNAVKFVKPGQKAQIRIWAKRRAELKPQGHNGGEWVRIWIEDQGVGIPEPLIPRVFDMFSRGHQDYEGTGIGLALVRKVMDRMGGKAGVESEEGKGSRFWLELRPAV